MSLSPIGTLVLAVLASAAATAVRAQSPAAPKPQRIVSINLCTDQLVLDLAPRERIRALSHLAADPAVSALYDKARGIPATRGEAEDVLAMDPDLVLAGAYTTPATIALLERIGRRVVKVPLASDIPGIERVVRQVAEAVGEKERGEALVGAFGDWLKHAAGRVPAVRPSALVYQVNAIASGSGSIAGTMLAAAHLTNHAEALGLGGGGTLPLETLVATPPDLLVLSGPVGEYRTVVAGNLRHPALATLIATRPSVTVPWRLWLCGTPYVAEAVRLLAETRDKVIERVRTR